MLLSGSIHAIVNAMIKGGGNRMVQMMLSSATGAVIALTMLPFVPLPHGAWGWLALVTGIHLAYFICLVRAFDAGDLSSAYPIFRGLAPLLTALGAIAAGEKVSAGALAGIALIGGGMLAMVAGRHVDRRTLGWSLATGVLIAAYTMADSYGVRAAPTPESFIAWLFLAMGTASLLVLPSLSGSTLKADVRAQWRNAALAGFLSFLTFALALYALAHGPMAQLAALRETGMVTALIISIVVLKEPVTPGRAGAIIAITAGAMVILIA